MQPISRRRALQLGGLGLTSIAVGTVGLTWRTLSGNTPAARQELAEPSTLTSTEGLLTVRLEAAEGPVDAASGGESNGPRRARRPKSPSQRRSGPKPKSGGGRPKRKK